ncbi:ATP-binding protein [Burkholderia pseudomultivorans]|uniref:ATP-binding protein n=1 Tax=Burkholderia pseudomultivorans TaxID=1207504 RepID=UPI00075244B5|nr:ATP-binding protein [Burkholderia pseudomultivorans]KVC27005.1 ATPase [Burkholderia pseudomultivorans]KVC28048.1 ATPase [Burkholderia pseudomultivorans]
MKPSVRLAALLAWLALSVTGTAFVVSRAVTDAYGRFFQDSSIAIRLLAQKAAQHEAILATLGASSLGAPPAHMLDSLRERMPQLDGLALWRRGAGWQADGGPAPNVLPQHRPGKPFTLAFDGPAAYWLVAESGWAVRVDPRRMFMAADWPASMSTAALELRDRRIDLLPSASGDALPLWTMRLDKHLPAQPQAFVLHTTRTLTAADLPWLPIALWNAVAALLVAGALGAWRLREARRREDARARLDRFSRLDTFGEMAAGLAHELNQPLTAIVSHTRAAERMLDEPAERDSVRRALQTSVAQAKRAAAILERLREAVTSAHGGERRPIEPDAIIGTLLFLYRDDCAREHVALGWHNAAPRARPFAEPIAVEQILHNLIQNARDALGGTSRGEIRIRGEQIGGHYRFSVTDNGPGVPEELLPRLFEPFFTTRERGLGLGLPLCDTLAQRQDGTLTVKNLTTGGVEAALLLPLAEAGA